MSHARSRVSRWLTTWDKGWLALVLFGALVAGAVGVVAHFLLTH